MKRLVLGLAAAAAAVVLAPQASAHPVCLYLDTPYPVFCVHPPEAK